MFSGMVPFWLLVAWRTILFCLLIGGQLYLAIAGATRAIDWLHKVVQGRLPRYRFDRHQIVLAGLGMAYGVSVSVLILYITLRVMSVIY